MERWKFTARWKRDVSNEAVLTHPDDRGCLEHTGLVTANRLATASLRTCRMAETKTFITTTRKTMGIQHSLYPN